MSEKTEYPELRKELSRLVELQSKNFLTNEADNLIKELQLVLGNPSPALQDAVKGKTGMLIMSIETHIETTEECIENFNLKASTIELLNQDIRLLKVVVDHLRSITSPTA